MAHNCYHNHDYKNNAPKGQIFSICVLQCCHVSPVVSLGPPNGWQWMTVALWKTATKFHLTSFVSSFPLSPNMNHDWGPYTAALQAPALCTCSDLELGSCPFCPQQQMRLCLSSVCSLIISQPPSHSVVDQDNDVVQLHCGNLLCIH